MSKQVHSDTEFASAIRGFKPVVVDFFATWCGPCKQIAPHFEKLAAKYSGRADFLKVDGDELKALCQAQAVEAYPTFVIFANGKEHGRVKGGDLDEVEKLLNAAFGKVGGRTLGGSSSPGAPSQETSPPPAGASANRASTGNALVDDFLLLCPQATEAEAVSYLEMAGGETELAAAIFSSTNPERTGPAPSSGGGGSGGVTRGTSSITTAKPPQAKPSKPQEYYAGGSKNSGTAIVDRPDPVGRRGDDGDLIGNIVNQAREQGELEGSGGGRGPAGFQQDGKRLGHTEGPSRTVNTGVRKEKTLKIAFYKNGIIVEDGPLRPIDDPATKEFLENLKAGRVPQELLQQYPNTEISVAVADHHDEDYVKKFKAFDGAGNSMQGPPSATAGGASADVPLESEVAVDESLPIVALALQLLDNTRMEVRVNPGVHTLNHVRTIAHRATPATPNFELWARDIPPRPLRDLSLTIEEAKVGRCVIFMKRK